MSTADHDARLPRTPASSLSGIEHFANALWYRSKAKLKGAHARRNSNIHTDPRQLRWLPPEIVEDIIAHLIYDLPALKACAAVCLSWYNIATPHLHHTLTFRERTPVTSNKDLHNYLSPLASLHKLGLLPFVKQVQFKRGTSLHSRVAPWLFDSRSMRYFRALVNLQDLAIADLDFSFFRAGVDRYFEHFSPTLRSVTLSCPRGTPRQLLDFLRLFPKLNDIRITYYYPKSQDDEGLDTQLVPIGGDLRGRLVLSWSGDMQFLLEAYAETLETLRVHPDTTLQDQPAQHPNLSHNTVLRSLEFPAPAVSSSAYSRAVRELHSTIASPVFSEIVVVFSQRDLRCPSEILARTLREMYEIREFTVVFCLETPEELRVNSLHTLTLTTREAVTAGLYDFLPYPPSVFSRTETGYDRFI